MVLHNVSKDILIYYYCDKQYPDHLACIDAKRVLRVLIRDLDPGHAQLLAIVRGGYAREQQQQHVHGVGEL